MANDGKQFDIELGTKADTSGLEATERALKAVEAAGKDAINPMADGGMLRAAEEIERATAAIDKQVEALEEIEEATAEIAPASKKADDGFGKLFDQQRLQGIGRQLAGLATTVGSFAREFEKTDSGQEFFSGMSEEVKVFGETALSIANGVAQGYAEGGPIGAAIGGLTQVVDKLSGGWLEMNARVKAAEAELEQAILANNARIRERKLEAAGREIEQTYRAEKQELEGQRQELERISKLRDAQADLDKARDRLADTKAIAAGTPQAVVDIGNVGQEFEAQRAKIRDELELARQQLQLLGNDLFNATKAYNSEVDRVGRKAADESGKLEAMNAARVATGVTEKNIIALQEQLNIQEQTFAAEAETKLVQQGERLLGSLESSASALEASLQAGIDAASGKGSTAAKAALADVQRVLEDGAVNQQDVTVLLGAVQRLQGSTEAKDQKTAEAINQITENGAIYNSNLQSAISTLNQQGRIIEAQGRELRQLKDRITMVGG